VQSLPLLLGICLGLLALLTIAHLLITSVRRRQRDLAILRTIGFTHRQVRQAVAWQASTLTAAALAIGVPLGIAGGRTAWLLFAQELGTRQVLDAPFLPLVVLVPIALALAVAVAAPSAESTARARLAGVLRSE
jgi:putative ABC transport system permease protein